MCNLQFHVVIEIDVNVILSCYNRFSQLVNIGIVFGVELEEIKNTVIT